MGDNKFNLICETINSGVFVIDAHYNVKYWNQWLTDHTNIDAKNIIGSSLLEHFPLINKKSFDRKIKTSLRLQGPTFYNISKEGYLLPIKLNNITPSFYKYMQQNVTILPYSLDDNEVIVYIYDNTALSEVNYKLKLAKEELEVKNKQLEEQNKRFETLLNSTMEALFVSDENHIITNVNNVGIDLFNVEDKDTLIGKHLLELIDPSSYNVVKQNIQKEVTEPYEITLLKNDDTTFPALVRGKSIETSGRLQRISAVIDLSDIKEKEKHLLEHTKLVSMGEMIGNIAHQWRQPLTVISTKATGMLMEKEFNLLTDEKLEKHCHDINTNAQHLSQTIDDFKNFIKGDKQKVNFNLSEEIDALLHLLESTIKGSNINVVLELDNSIQLFGYPNELKQVMINIFNNARDALENIDESERYFFLHTYKVDNHAYICMRDNANGIPENIINKIFEPYFTTKHQSQGTGLGLHMSFNLIKEGLNGKIIPSNVTYSHEDIRYSGAEFKIVIPTVF